MNNEREGIGIDPKFSERDDKSNRSYQEAGKAIGLTYENAKEGINAGGEVNDYKNIAEGINHGFSAEESNEGLSIGLQKNDNLIALYARGSDHDPKILKGKINELEIEFKEWENNPKSFSTYLDSIYPITIRNRIRKLEIDFRQEIEFPSEVIINGAEGKSLREIKFFNVKFKSLLLLNFEQLTLLELLICEIEGNLEMFGGLVNLIQLRISRNSFSGNLNELINLTKLESLDLSYNPLINGNLLSLQSLTNLKSLDIRGINITEGLEHLPDNLERLYCDLESFPELKDYKMSNYCKYSIGKEHQKVEEIESLNFIINEEQIVR